MQRNPYGKVPVLVDGDGIIYESAVINEYLDEKFTDHPLMPRNQLDRAKVRIWVDFFNTRVHPTASNLQKNREPEKARVKMAEHLGTLDDALAGRDYLVSNQFSLADVTFIPFYTRRERYTVNFDNYPNIKRWAENLIARPQVAPTL